MAGYVALQRIDRVSVRALAWHGSMPVEDAPKCDGPADVGAGQLEVRTLAERLAERWMIVREQWAMTTFFLLDPESWR